MLLKYVVLKSLWILD